MLRSRGPGVDLDSNEGGFAWILDQTHDEEERRAVDPEEQHELVMDRRSVLKRVGLGAAALSVPTAVMASPAMGAVTRRARG